MNQRRPVRDRTGMSTAPIGWSLVILIATCGPARGQFAEEGPAPAPLTPPMIGIAEANFDRWVFGSDEASQAAYDRLERVLTVRIGDLERTCGLSPAQKNKLLLAGRVDIQRFRAQVAAARSTFDHLRSDRANLPAVTAETRSLAKVLAGDFFGDGSIFTKTTAATLDPAQQAHRRAVLAERGRLRHRALVARAVADLGMKVGFATHQAERFTGIILAETSPPERPAGPFEGKLVLYQIASIPASKLQPIFDDYQWRALNRRLVDARSDEPSLRAYGLLDSTGSTSTTQPD